MILDTFADVALWARLYLEETGSVGLSAGDAVWFRHIMNVNIFQLGPIQFQPFAMIYLDEETIGEDCMRFDAAQKGVLPAGTPVLNCHVQTDVQWDAASIDAAFAQADRFFEAEYKAYLCYGWLLYPAMQKHLPQAGNICRFAQQFTVLASCGDNEQARENIRPETRLARLLAERPEDFGYACGVRRRSGK